ncbi:hypothetical protein FJZ31_12850 [Candidatus Poribacteria bacterium]|nr:hypothetical protein [Candidatus Poribacteria bacterium]
MAVDDYLIWERVVYLVEQRYEQLGIEWYTDYYDVIRTKRLSTKRLQFAGNTSVMLYEEYDIVEYKLKIFHYCYTFCDSDGKEIFRADNSEHHNVSTTPHHIHDFRFGDEKIKPFHRQELDNPDITEFFAHIRGERR